MLFLRRRVGRGSRSVLRRRVRIRRSGAGVRQPWRRHHRVGPRAPASDRASEAEARSRHPNGAAAKAQRARERDHRAAKLRPHEWSLSAFRDRREAAHSNDDFLMRRESCMYVSNRWKRQSQWRMESEPGKALRNSLFGTISGKMGKEKPGRALVLLECRPELSLE